ncbi:hypothetical protein VNO78_25746 [Psophocarpus tetragonolobus]|uniref:Uncharacterized protein n=1 Tax=Psophocarpus tetragonolobus TaxID=3891 RepID=A0AAN9S7H5_PSOTE
MFNLSKLLSHRGHKVTFINTHHNHNRFLQFTDIASFQTQFPNLHFASITDGLSQNHPPKGTPIDYYQRLMSHSARSLVAKEFGELLLRLVEKNEQWQPPSCIIADGLMSTIVNGGTRVWGSMDYFPNVQCHLHLGHYPCEQTSKGRNTPSE